MQNEACINQLIKCYSFLVALYSPPLMILMCIALVTSVPWSPAKEDKGDTVLAIHFIRGAISGLEDKQQHWAVHL